MGILQLRLKGTDETDKDRKITGHYMGGNCRTTPRPRLSTIPFLTTRVGESFIFKIWIVINSILKLMFFLRSYMLITGTILDDSTFCC